MNQPKKKREGNPVFIRFLKASVHAALLIL